MSKDYIVVTGISVDDIKEHFGVDDDQA